MTAPRRGTRPAGKRTASRRAVQRRATPPQASDRQEAAQSAGLRYVTDGSPGIRRRRAGAGFSYAGPDGKAIQDSRTQARIRALAIPPAYTEVWICPRPDGHIQATGRDARGRKQYRYHPRWREVRDETKFGRMLAFSEVLPRIRRRVEADLARPGLPREKVVAAVVRLLECTGLRVGNDEYARANDSFGLTTLRDRHVAVSGSTIRFEFRGKSGKKHRQTLSDHRLARIVSRGQALPGKELFEYVRAGPLHHGAGGQAGHRPSDRPGGGAAPQYPQRLPDVLHPSGGVRQLQRWGDAGGAGQRRGERRRLWRPLRRGAGHRAAALAEGMNR